MGAGLSEVGAEKLAFYSGQSIAPKGMLDLLHMCSLFMRKTLEEDLHGSAKQPGRYVVVEIGHENGYGWLPGRRDIWRVERRTTATSQVGGLAALSMVRADQAGIACIAGNLTCRMWRSKVPL